MEGRNGSGTELAASTIQDVRDYFLACERTLSLL